MGRKSRILVGSLSAIVLMSGVFGCKSLTSPKGIDREESEGVYDLINLCCDRARGNQEWNVASSHRLVRGLGYTNDFAGEIVYLSYDNGQAKLRVGEKVVPVSIKQMRDYIRK